MIAHALEPHRTLPLEEALRDLALKLKQEMLPEQRARLMNIAGDLSFDAGQRERAMLYFDAAIDLYLTTGRFAASAGICEKLVELNPQVIRARCTLAWLAIARGLDDEARQRVEEYGEASLRLERPTIAQQQLRAMADEVDSQDVLEAVARALLRLGDAASADRVLEQAHSPSPRRRRSHASPADRNRSIISRLTSAWNG